MKLFLKNYLSLVLLSLLTLFSCVEKSTTDSNNSSTSSLAIEYEVSGKIYIARINKALELIQKGNFDNQSNFSVSPPLPNGLDLDVTNGNISGTPTTVSSPASYTITATKDGKTYTKTISLGISPSQVWVTHVNPANPYQLTAFLEGDSDKQINDWAWGSSDDNFATVSNGMVDFKTTTTRRTVVIFATNHTSTGSVQVSYSNGVSLSVDKVELVNGEKIITEGTNVRLAINSNRKTITNDQFRRKNLTLVYIPNSVTTIGDSAFADNKLTHIVIPNSVTSIGNNSFVDNQLTRLVIPNSVTHIGGEAFSRNQLTHVVIPNSVTTIVFYTFSRNQLTSLVIPNSVTSIDGDAFADNDITNVTIPNSVVSIGPSAFRNNLLTSVFIPDSVTNINGSAFRQVTNLGQVSLKQSLYTWITNTSSTNAIFGGQVTNYIKR